MNQIVYTTPFFIGTILSMFILHRMRIYTKSGIFFSSPSDIIDKHKEGIIEIGGIAIFPILIIALCLTLGMSRWLKYYNLIDLQFQPSGDRILQVLAGCGLLYIVGLKNDIHGTFGHTKFMALLAATSLFPISGLWIRDLQGLFGIHALSPWTGIPLTITLAMYISETIALMDDIDGLGIGLSSIMLTIFLGFSVVYCFPLGILITSAGLGVAITYSMHKMFLTSWQKTLSGNAGSYVLGYFLAYASLSLLSPAGVEMPNGTLMIVLGIVFVPMIDLLRTLRTRIRQRRSVLSPDRNLMQHRFIRMGVPSKLTPLCIIALMTFFAALNTIWVLLGLNLTTLAIVDVMLWFAVQLGIQYAIQHHEDKQDHIVWNMTYGREVWEADTPVETIRRKQKDFGIMGMSPKYILGDETDFIPDGMSSFERNTKRLIDFLVASILLIIFSPLFLLSYILIKLDDHGPAIFQQERIGRFGRPFMIYKFRSMRLDAEKNGPALSHSGGQDDDRLTRVGRFLRAHHLDELPQLWNVFRGDMSFIGYRPERKFYIDQIMQHDPRYSMLYQIRPGVTSYATLYNGYTDTMEKMLRRLTYDLYYLEHRSFWFDAQILWRTFLSIVFGKEI